MYYIKELLDIVKDSAGGDTEIPLGIVCDTNEEKRMLCEYLVENFPNITRGRYGEKLSIDYKVNLPHGSTITIEKNGEGFCTRNGYEDSVRRLLSSCGKIVKFTEIDFDNHRNVNSDEIINLLLIS